MEKFEQSQNEPVEEIEESSPVERPDTLAEKKDKGGSQVDKGSEQSVPVSAGDKSRERDRITELKAELDQLVGEKKERKIINPDQARTWKSLEQKVDMPHVAGIAERIAEQSKKDGVRYDPEAVKDILYCFLEKGIENTRMFASKKHEASFPYTTVDTAAVAKALYEVYSGREVGPLKSPEETSIKKRLEFLFGSFQLISHGNQFTFTEEILHQIFKDLPAALEKIDRGEEPVAHEVCVVGSPTTATGTMSQKFLEEIKSGAFETYGDMYAELVELMIPKDEEEKKDTSVMLYGISMGASFAGQTAKRILEDGYVTQSRDDEEKPFMQVRIDTAPGHRNKPGLLSKIKLFGGFAASAAYTLATDRYTRDVIFKNGKYMEQVNKLLAEKGLAKSNLTPDQTAMKKQGISLVENALAKGVAWPEGVKATEVVGLQDALTYDAQLNKEAYAQRKKSPDSLGAYSVPNQGGEDIRVRSAEMTHAIPFTQRENEKKRMLAGVASLTKLKEKYSA